MRRITLFIISVLVSLCSFGQNLTQTIRGQLYDEDSRSAIIGAVVTVKEHPTLGAYTNEKGEFRLEDVPVGRVTIQVMMMGYEPRVIPNQLLSSGKELVVTISLKEDVKQLEVFEVKASQDKRQTNNEMSIVSSRSFTIEETKRYAGSFNDPARMAASFAGISSDAQGNNDIVVRGNSPKGILWRLEGVEIPNPNHFADEGATGGPINALNSTVLANSDFLTGAFEPEYGNATSGVFDIKMRKGNNEQREYTFAMGVIGTEFMLEGPFSKNGKGSYMANYRYSSLGILDNLNVVDFGGVPIYQDAAFKLHLPTEKVGTFSIWGLGGLSNIKESWSDTSAATGVVEKGRTDYGANLGMIGFNNVYLLNEQSFLKTDLLVSTNGSGTTVEESIDEGPFATDYQDGLQKYNLKFQTAFNRKINARNRLKIGVIATYIQYDFYSKYRDDNGLMVSQLNKKGNSGFAQGYVSWKHRANEKLTLVGGVHALQLFLNDRYSVEPRLSMQWKATTKGTFTAGVGLHSRIESLLNYFAEVQQASGTVQPNINMKLPKAVHAVMGYDHSINDNTHIKTEVYYQRLYHVPVENAEGSTYSLINESEWFDDLPLVNTGEGYNYGIELTFERFFSNNFYYLLTGSVYESQYKAEDGIWRKTRFNGNYNSNVLFGKEFPLKAKESKQRTITLNVKASLLGGNRFTPLDLTASMNEGRTVRVSEPWSAKGDDVFFVNVGGGYRVNRSKATHEIKFEVLNATNNQAMVNQYYDANRQKVVNSNQLPLIPNLIYQVQF